MSLEQAGETLQGLEAGGRREKRMEGRYGWDGEHIALGDRGLGSKLSQAWFALWAVLMHHWAHWIHAELTWVSTLIFVLCLRRSLVL